MEEEKSKGIAWGRAKVLVVLFAFIVSIACICLSFIPLTEPSLSREDWLILLMGLGHFLRLMEFTRVKAEKDLCLWVLNSALYSAVTFFVATYDKTIRPVQ